MRHLIHQINKKTTPFNIYILAFGTIWVFVKLYELVVGVCNVKNWIYVGHNNTFIAVCLCLKVVLSSGLIYMTFFLVLFVIAILFMF